jgi:hypothetical protein
MKAVLIHSLLFKGVHDTGACQAKNHLGCLNLRSKKSFGFRGFFGRDNQSGKIN